MVLIPPADIPHIWGSVSMMLSKHPQLSLTCLWGKARGNAKTNGHAEHPPLNLTSLLIVCWQPHSHRSMVIQRHLCHIRLQGIKSSAALGTEVTSFAGIEFTLLHHLKINKDQKGPIRV